MKNRPEIVDQRDFGRKSVKFPATMTTISGSYQIHTEARGPHWIAWITRGSDTKPDRSVVLVAASEAEAQERARQWAEQSRY
jgi:hypothetical protein